MTQARINNRLFKTRRKTTILCILLVSVCFFSSYLSKKPSLYNEKVFAYYVQQANATQKELAYLKTSAEKKVPGKQLIEQFAIARKTYKNLAVLSEFFDGYYTKFINGPALPRVEEDHPTEIIPPHGYQLLEEKIFSKKITPETYEEIATEAGLMIETLEKMKTVPDLIYSFKDAYVFDALRSSVIRLVTLGIAGFDSPVAQGSLSEAIATLEGIQTVLSFYSIATPAKSKLEEAIGNAKGYLLQHQDPLRFNYVEFIKHYSNPLSHTLYQVMKDGNYLNASTRLPFNINASSLFDSNFFNADFFSPNVHYRYSKERLELGKKLFYDPILSGNGKRSCSSCHQPEKAFTDGLEKAVSINESMLDRNTPTLWNAVFQTKQFYDSRASTLENQFSEVVHNAKEMSGSLKNSEQVLSDNKTYAALFKTAYPSEKTPITQYTIANAVAIYVRSLISLNSRFDQFMRGDDKKLTREEQFGFNLFMGKAKCATCHFIPLFNGLVPPEFNETESEVLGIPASAKKKTKQDNDLGKFLFTKAPIHQHAFKTPTLRNVALTAPYMHNGVFKTLEEVIEFYNKGGGINLGFDVFNQTLPATKLNLSKQEKKALIAFLKSLTDTSGAK